MTRGGPIFGGEPDHLSSLPIPTKRPIDHITLVRLRSWAELPLCQCNLAIISVHVRSHTCEKTVIQKLRDVLADKKYSLRAYSRNGLCPIQTAPSTVHTPNHE